MGRVWSRVAASLCCVGWGAMALSVACGRTAKDGPGDEPSGTAGMTGGVEPPGIEPNCAISLASNEGQHCATYQDGGVWCWGTEGDGSDPVLQPSDTTMPDADDYVIDEDGVVLDLAQGKAPLPEYGADNAWYSGPGTPSCVLKRTGSLWCTSSNPNVLDDSRLFAKAELGERVSQAGTGNQFFCALSERQVWCEGLDRQGQTASGDNQRYARGSFVGGLRDVRSLSVNDDSACALQGDGSVWCWGRDAEGKHGTTPTQISGCVQQSAPPADPASLWTIRPSSVTHLDEGALARAQAMCACAFGDNPPQSCIDAEIFAPNARCMAALLPGLNPGVDCRATSRWQDAECYATQACKTFGTVDRACMSLTCPTDVPSAFVESYCRRQVCALDFEHNLTPAELCNGVPDCDDGSDERNCSDLGGLFECNPETRIPVSKVCDAVPDCDDGSDEQYCG